MLVGRHEVHDPKKGSMCPCRTCRLRLMAQGPQYNSLLQEGEELLADVARMETYALERNAELRRRRGQWLEKAVTEEVGRFLNELSQFKHDEQKRGRVLKQMVKLLLNHPYEHVSLYEVEEECTVFEDEDMEVVRKIQVYGDEDMTTRKMYDDEEKDDAVKLVPEERLMSRRKRDWPQKIIEFASGWVHEENLKLVVPKKSQSKEEVDPVTDPDVSTLA